MSDRPVEPNEGQQGWLTIFVAGMTTGMFLSPGYLAIVMACLLLYVDNVTFHAFLRKYLSANNFRELSTKIVSSCLKWLEPKNKQE